MNNKNKDKKFYENIKIETPSLKDLNKIDKIALQVHECHVKWRPDIFEHTDSIISQTELSDMIKNNTIFVAKIDDEALGYVIISSREYKKNGYKYRKELDIDAIGVDEVYRNHGIGRKLLEFIKQYAKDNDYTDMRLTVNEENINGIHLYEKVGFKVKNIAYSMKVK